MEDNILEISETIQIGVPALQKISILTTLHDEISEQQEPKIRIVKHILILSGQAYTAELLECNNEEGILEDLHMPIETFLTLCKAVRSQNFLYDTRYKTVEHQVHIFIPVVIVGHHV